MRQALRSVYYNRLPPAGKAELRSVVQADEALADLEAMRNLNQQIGRLGWRAGQLRPPGLASPGWRPLAQALRLEKDMRT